MTVRTLLLAVAALSLAACSGGLPNTTTTPDVSSLVGTWTADVATADSNVIERSFTIRDDSVVFETICRADGKVVIVKATSPAIVTDHAIAILRTDEQYKAAGSEVCKAQVDRGLISYEIKDGALLLTPKGKSQFVFGRKDKLFPGLDPEGKAAKGPNAPGDTSILL